MTFDTDSVHYTRIGRIPRNIHHRGRMHGDERIPNKNLIDGIAMRGNELRLGAVVFQLAQQIQRFVIRHPDDAARAGGNGV